MDSLPVLNYSNPDRDALSRQISEVMGDLGFLYLENVPGFDEDGVKWCVDFFFNLPETKKMEVARNLYNPKNTNVSS